MNESKVKMFSDDQHKHSEWVESADKKTEETNKAAIYGFGCFLLSILFIILGLPLALSETYFILIFGFIFLAGGALY